MKLKVSFLSILPPILHNKILLLNESINTFLIFLMCFIFNLPFLWLIGVIVSWYQSILSIIHLPHSYLTKLLLNSFSRKDSYSHFCAFGCLCYGSTFASHRTKFSPWATIIIFLGYPPGYKGYKLLDLSTNFIFIFGMLFFMNPFFSSKPLIHHNPNPPPTFFLLSFTFPSH